MTFLNEIQVSWIVRQIVHMTERPKGHTGGIQAAIEFLSRIFRRLQLDVLRGIAKADVFVGNQNRNFSRRLGLMI